jgi:hypothetical protein
MKWIDVEWTDVIYVNWFYFVVQWSEVKFLGIKLSFGWPYTEGTWLYCDCFIWGYLVLCLSYLVLWYFNLYCGCCAMCGNLWLCLCVGFVMCGCSGNMYTCIYCVLYCLYRVLYCLFYVYLFGFLYYFKDYCHKVTTQLHLLVVVVVVVVVVTDQATFKICIFWQDIWGL